MAKAWQSGSITDSMAWEHGVHRGLGHTDTEPFRETQFISPTVNSGRKVLHLSEVLHPPAASVSPKLVRKVVTAP